MSVDVSMSLTSRIAKSDYVPGALQFSLRPWILSWSARLGFDSYTVTTGSNLRYK